MNATTTRKQIIITQQQVEDILDDSMGTLDDLLSEKSINLARAREATKKYVLGRIKEDSENGYFTGLREVEEMILNFSEGFLAALGK